MKLNIQTTDVVSLTIKAGQYGLPLPTGISLTVGKTTVDVSLLLPEINIVVGIGGENSITTRAHTGVITRLSKKLKGIGISILGVGLSVSIRK